MSNDSNPKFSMLPTIIKIFFDIKTGFSNPFELLVCVYIQTHYKFQTLLFFQQFKKKMINSICPKEALPNPKSALTKYHIQTKTNVNAGPFILFAGP